MHSSSKSRKTDIQIKTTIMIQIDKDFVYNRFPKTEHDMQLLETFKQSFLSKIAPNENQHPLSDIMRCFPVYEGTVGAEKD